MVTVIDDGTVAGLQIAAFSRFEHRGDGTVTQRHGEGTVHQPQKTCPLRSRRNEGIFRFQQCKSGFRVDLLEIGFDELRFFPFRKDDGSTFHLSFPPVSDSGCVRLLSGRAIRRPSRWDA